jgi:hypothetical protein
MDMNSHSNMPLILGMGIAAVGVVLFACFANWWGLNISVQSQTIANVLAPLLLTAGFIERAVEVVITPWRDPEANELEANLKAVSANATATATQQKDAIDNLNAYVAATTRYAFVIAVIFGLVAAMVGIRALWPFLDPLSMAVFSKAPLGQRNTFIVFDVVLSAALMAGGANGIHSVITAFTSFFDANAQKSKNSVNP